MSSSTVDSAIRKAIDLNVQYYSSLGRLTVNYWRDVFRAVAATSKAQTPPPHFAAHPTPPTAPQAAASDAPKPAAMVIEAEPGSVGMGVFLVENHLRAEVDSAVVASFFKDPSGSAIQPAFAFDPPRVVLKPGEQVLMRVTTTIGPELEIGQRYSGEFAVPGLKGTSIPVILRSRGKQ
jgi:hypothetical protein